MIRGTIVTCAQCKKEFTLKKRRRIFCSVECCKLFNRLHFKVYRFCPVCRAEISRIRFHNHAKRRRMHPGQRVYCSMACFKEMERMRLRMRYMWSVKKAIEQRISLRLAQELKTWWDSTGAPPCMINRFLHLPRDFWKKAPYWLKRLIREARKRKSGFRKALPPVTAKIDREELALSLETAKFCAEHNGSLTALEEAALRSLIAVGQQVLNWVPCRAWASEKAGATGVENMPGNPLHIPDGTIVDAAIVVIDIRPKEES